MSALKEISIAIARIALGMVVLIEGLTVLVLINYTGTIGSTYGDKVAAAYEDSYDNGYAQTYDVGYQEAYGEAYDKGYEIGLEIGSKEGVASLVELRDPTHKEMREFLTGDETDSNPYVVGEYNCIDFSAQLSNNAEANGIRVAYVRIRAREWGHVLVAFETTDRGLIFIEPQSDREAELVIGEPFPWYSVGAVSALSPYDPVVEIQIIW